MKYSNRTIPMAAGALALLGVGASLQAATQFYPGLIKREIYSGLTGTALAALTNSAAYLAGTPSSVTFLPQIDSPNNLGDNYGGKMSGFIIPSESGQYRLYVAGDDSTTLFVSTDASRENLQQVAYEPVWGGYQDFNSDILGNTAENARPSCIDGDPATPCENESPILNFTAGQRYYFEVLWKEGGGGDHASVAWVRAGEIVVDGPDNLIPSANLGVEASDTPEILGQPTSSHTYRYVGETVTLTASVYLPPENAPEIQWLKDGVAIPDSNTTRLVYTTVAADAGKTLNFHVQAGSAQSTTPAQVRVIAPEPEVLSPGFVKVEYFRDISGVSVWDNLLIAEKFVNDQPDETLILNSFRLPVDYMDNYGARVTGYILPQETGSYRFFIRSDDASAFYLNTTPNGPTPNPYTDFPIAEETDCCDPFVEPGTFNDDGLTSPTTEAIQLTGGQRYAFLFLVKEGTGGDFGEVTWRREGDTTPAADLPVLSGPYIGAVVQAAGFDLEIVQQPTASPSSTILEDRSVTISANVVASPNPDFAFHQWHLNGSPIPGATGLSYTTPPLAVGTYRYSLVSYTLGNKSLTSDELTVTVQEDTVPPVITRVSAVSSDAVNIVFDEPLDPQSAATAANYSISPGTFTIQSATLSGGSSSNVVRLDLVGEIVAGSEYTVTVQNVADVYGNALGSVSRTFTARIVTYADIILADGPIAFYRFEETSGSTALNQGTRGAEANGVYMAGEAQGTAKTDAGPTPASGFGGFSGSNRAAVFDGVQDWINTTQPLLNGLSAFSLEYWVKPLRTNELGEVWSGGGANGDSPNRVGIVGQNDAVEYGFIDPNTIQIWTPSGGSLNSTYTFPDNEWHHVATIADGTTIRNYFDGVLVGTGGSSTGGGAYGTSTFNVTIGGGGVFDATGNFFRGQIDEVAIFDKAIPAERIAAHFLAGKQGGVIEEEEPEFTSITASGNNVTIEWTGGGTLESANSVDGDWTPVANATSPYTTQADQAAQFYRVRGN